MIFNINEINEKIEQKKSSKKRPPVFSPAVLDIIPQPSPVQSQPKVFKIVKPAAQKRSVSAKIIIDKHNLNKSSSKILLALLYWSNGSKYPSSNFVAFSNSDHNLVKTFVSLFRKTFDIDDSKIKVQLQLRPEHDTKKVIPFWSKLLNIPTAQFYKPNIIKTSKKTRSQNYFGTCTVRYYSLDLLLAIMNIYEGLADIF